MNDIDKKELASMIQTLFNTRNQQAGVETLASWGAFLRDYDIEKLRASFNRYIKYGDTFPSLPAIIALVESRVDSDTASIDAWASVYRAIADRTSKNLSPAEKEVIKRIAPGGLTELMEADKFTLQGKERDFKKMYKAAYDGISRELSIEPSWAVQLLQVAQTKAIENGGLFKSE